MDGIAIQQILQTVIPIVGIVCGTLLAGYIIGKIFGLIKAWINRGNTAYDEEKIDQIARAFIKHKKDTEQRLQHIEAIISKEKTARSSDSSKRQLSESKSRETIEIDSDQSESDKEQTGSSKLENMLNKQGQRNG